MDEGSRKFLIVGVQGFSAQRQSASAKTAAAVFLTRSAFVSVSSWPGVTS
jgi:L,D-peptidoglycan transpeptidase YkuD (ErfK/YbiS/YcfS/YnhG family)